MLQWLLLEGENVSCGGGGAPVVRKVREKRRGELKEKEKET